MIGTCRPVGVGEYMAAAPATLLELRRAGPGQVNRAGPGGSNRPPCPARSSGRALCGRGVSLQDLSQDFNLPSQPQGLAKRPSPISPSVL